jgi:hypothetical protein
MQRAPLLGEQQQQAEGEGGEAAVHGRGEHSGP